LQGRPSSLLAAIALATLTTGTCIALVAGCSSQSKGSDDSADGATPGDASDASSPPPDAAVADAAPDPDIGNGWMPRPVHAACAAPVVTPGLVLAVPAGRIIASARLAWGDGDAAVIYGETTASGYVIRLQRLTEKGAASGAPIDLGTIQSIAGPYLAIAGDATRYVGCWNSYSATPSHIDCAEVVKGSSVAKVVASQDARFPALAYGPGGFIVSGFSLGMAYAGVVGKGEYVYIDKGILGAAALAPTPSGYAMAVGQASMNTHRLSPGLKKIGSPTTTQIPNADERSIRLAADGENVLAVWAESGPSQVLATLDAKGAVTTPKRIDDATAPMTNTPIIGAARGAGSYAVVWPSDMGGAAVWYRAVDGTGSPMGTPVKVATGADVPELVEVGDGFLLASTINTAQLTVMHLACP
jgi:hypothetical protein